jgi:hypothetical protein
MTIKQVVKFSHRMERDASPARFTANITSWERQSTDWQVVIMMHCRKSAGLRPCSKRWLHHLTMLIIEKSCF